MYSLVKAIIIYTQVCTHIKVKLISAKKYERKL